jgi:peptidoglycan hydrolase FlgJ
MANLPISTETVKLERTTSIPLKPEKPIDREKLKKSCTDFEAIMVSQLVKSMRQISMGPGLLGDGLGKGLYESLVDQELSQSLAKRGGFGLGKMIYNRTIQQEERRKATPPETESKQTDPRDTKIPSIRQKGNDHAIFGR